ncbi:HEAT repeat domain-containing protein [Candidatus Micrarchaeota archaeon]|nr:HEAT repeat domain-containing protein [Candidatus Micrarchaeota archaeon]
MPARKPTARELEKLPENIREHMKNLFHEDDGVRRSAVKKLETIALRQSQHAPAITQYVIETLETGEWRDKMNAADALGKIGSEKAIPALIKATRYVGPTNDKYSAIMALGSIGSEKTIPRLIRLLQADQYDVRSIAAQALGNTKKKRAIQPLIEAMKKDADEAVRKSAATALGTIGYENAIQPLLQAIERDGEVSSEATLALGGIRSEKVIQLLTRLLNKRNEQIRRSAAQALGNLESELAIPPLIKALQKNSGLRVRREAASALEKTGLKSLEQTPVFDENHEHYPFLTAIKHVKPSEHLKAFTRLFEDLKKPRYKNNSKEWWEAHAQQLRSLEPKLKQAA